MIALGLALLCFQSCLVQTVFSQTRCVRSPFDYAPGLWASSCGEFGPYNFPGSYRGILAGPFSGLFAGPGELATGPVGAYGGEGVGEVSVAGELPAGGATDVAGEVPILGAVEFAGPVRAAGTVTISGTCGCGRSFFY